MRGCAGAATLRPLDNKCHHLRSVQFLVPPGSCERCEARCSNSRSGGLRAHQGSITAPLDFIPLREAIDSRGRHCEPTGRANAHLMTGAAPPRGAVIASGAKQSILSFCCDHGLLRGACQRARIRATRWLAMTSKRECATSPRHAPEPLMNFPPIEGVGNAGCPLHPRSRVHLVVVERTRVTTSTPESPDVPARNGFNGFLRALPGDRALLPPSLSGYVLSKPGRADLTPRT